ncbi:MAG: helix-turn-helix transcriptional regulator [Hyphomicrobiaceae bacterium]
MQSREVILKALELTAKLYPGAFEPAAWSDALPDLAHFLRATMARVNLLRLSDLHLYASYGHGVSRQTESLRQATPKTLASDPRLKAALRRPNEPVHCRQLVDTNTLHASSFYRKYLKPFGIEYAMGVPVVVQDHDFVLTLAAMRGPSLKPFNRTDLERLALLIPNLVRIGRIAGQAHRQRVATRALESAFDSSSIPLMLVDRLSTIMRANSAAAALLADEKWIRSRNGKLVHPDATAAERLLNAIGEVVRHARLNSKSRVHHISLPRPGQTHPLIATVCSLAPEQSDTDNPPLGWPQEHAYAAVFVSDPTRTVRMSAERLKTLFPNITDAEASVLCLLAGGHTADEIAGLRRRTPGTVRTQIKSIMQKTHAHRRFELIRMILFSEPPVT